MTKDGFAKQYIYPILVRRGLIGAWIVVVVSCLVWGIPSLLWLRQQKFHHSKESTIAHIFLICVIIPTFTFVGITLNRSHAGGLGILKDTLSVTMLKWTLSVVCGAILAVTLHSLLGQEDNNDSNNNEVLKEFTLMNQRNLIKSLLPTLVLSIVLHDVLALTKSFELIHLRHCSLWHFNPWLSIVCNAVQVSFHNVLLVVMLFLVDKVIEVITTFLPWALAANGTLVSLGRIWHGLVFTNSAFLFTLFTSMTTSLLVTLAVQVFSYLWLLPIDFSKVAFEKKPSEEILLSSLRILQCDSMLFSSTATSMSNDDGLDNSNKSRSASSLYTRKLTQYMKQTDSSFSRLYTHSTIALPISSYYGMGPSDCVSSVPTLLGLDGYNMEIYLGLLTRSLAFNDLNNAVKGDSLRRQLLLSGKCWDSLIDSVMKMLIECAVQIQAFNSHIREVKTAKSHTSTVSTPLSTGLAQPISSAKPREPITVAELRALKSGNRIPTFDHAQDSRMTALSPAQNQTMVESLEALWDNNVQPQVTALLLQLQGFPQSGELSNEQTRLPQHIADFMRSILSPLMSQTLVNAIESVSLLLDAALKEDKEGNTIHCVPAILYVLLKLDQSFEKYAGILQQSFTAKVASLRGVQYIRYKIHASQYLPKEVVAVCNANKDGILSILRNYSDLIAVDMFPHEFHHQLKGYLLEL